MVDWSFLSNHGLALLCIARDPNVRIREIAEYVGIQERAAHRIVSELVKTGYITKGRHGNRNRYELRTDVPMRHPLLRDHRIGEMLAALAQRPLPEVGRPTLDGVPVERRSSERRRAERRSDALAPQERE